jgi:hypothetical protein
VLSKNLEKNKNDLFTINDDLNRPTTMPIAIATIVQWVDHAALFANNR